MNRFVTLLCFHLILIFLSNSLFGQYPVWQWQNPLPQGNDLNDIQFMNALTGYAIGDGATVLKTTDGGQHWNVRFIGNSNTRLKSLQMLNAQIGWAIAQQSGQSSEIYFTTDGWQNWQSLISIPDRRINCMHWVDASNGWIGTEMGGYVTMDGGQNWTTFLDTLNIQSIFFLNSSTGWIGSMKTVYRTTDGGQTWNSTQIFPYGLNSIKRIQFINSQQGWLITEELGPNYYAGEIFYSADGGITWTVQKHIGNSFGPYRAWADFKMLNATQGYASSTDGIIFRTTDGGATWLELDTLFLGSQIDFVDMGKGWCVGKSGVIYHTNNAGENWQPQYSGFIPPDYNYVDIQFLDNYNGFYGTNHMLIKTVDGGNHWQNVELPSNLIGIGISALYFLTPQKGWISWETFGGWGKILYTENGGQTITVQKDSIYRCFDIFFVNENVGWAGGNAGQIYFTSDGGQHWVEKPLPTQGVINSIYFVNPQIGWLGGWNTLLYTNDGGTTWIPQQVGNDSSFIIQRINFYDTRRGFAIDQYVSGGKLYRTKWWTNLGACIYRLKINTGRCDRYR